MPGNLLTAEQPYPDPTAAQTLTVNAATLTPYGTWTFVGSGSDQYEYTTLPTADAYASWTFSNLVPGQRYELEETWTANTSNTTNASVTLTNGSATVYQSGIQRGTFPHRKLCRGRGRLAEPDHLHRPGHVRYGHSERFDDGNRVVAQAVQIQQARPLTTYTYDAFGNQTSVIDPMGNETDTTYDALGQFELSQTGPYSPGNAANAPVTQYFYNTAEQQTAVLDPHGELTTYAYDLLGRVIESSAGEWLETGAFNLAQSPGRSRSYEIYVFSSAPLTGDWESGYGVSDGTFTKTDSVTVPLGTGSSGSWYDLGAVVLSSGDATPSLTVTYDAGAVPGPVSLTEIVSQTAYDAAGNVASTTDALGRTTSFQYDAMGDKVAVIQPQPAAGQPRPSRGASMMPTGTSCNRSTPWAIPPSITTMPPGSRTLSPSRRRLRGGPAAGADGL